MESGKFKRMHGLRIELKSEQWEYQGADLVHCTSAGTDIFVIICGRRLNFTFSLDSVGSEYYKSNAIFLISSCCNSTEE